MATTLQKAIEKIEDLKTNLYARDEKYFGERQFFTQEECSFYKSISADYFKEYNLKILPTIATLLESLGGNYKLTPVSLDWLQEINYYFGKE